jgi:hypothetical protein
MSSGPSRWVTASCWARLRSSSSGIEALLGPDLLPILLADKSDFTDAGPLC